MLLNASGQNEKKIAKKHNVAAAFLDYLLCETHKTSRCFYIVEIFPAYFFICLFKPGVLIFDPSFTKKISRKILVRQV